MKVSLSSKPDNGDILRVNIQPSNPGEKGGITKVCLLQSVCVGVVSHNEPNKYILQDPSFPP